jgi:hypothetical protein
MGDDLPTGTVQAYSHSERPLYPIQSGRQEWYTTRQASRPTIAAVMTFTCNRNSTRSNNQPQPIQIL